MNDKVLFPLETVSEVFNKKATWDRDNN
ncbi:hypothetical protein [Chengkuizengella axinellae]